MSEPKKKKGKYPWGAIFWGTLGVAAGVRALYRPDRAIIRDGFVQHCAASAGCDPLMTVLAFEGSQPVFAPMRARVISAAPGAVYLVPKDEAVLLEILGEGGSTFTPQVATGEDVGAGQQIGLASRVRFAVYEIKRTAAGGAQIGNPIEPAAWLAVHGLSISTKKHKSEKQWCETGRAIVAPPNVASCLRLPPPSGFALLPISVTTG